MKNISKIISTVFLSFSILLLCYVFYRSQVLHSGTKFDYYFKYYVIAFLFILLSFISFFISKKLKIYSTIVFITILIDSYLIEGYLFIKKNLNLDTSKYLIYKNNTGKAYDKRSKFQIFQDLSKKESNIVISISPDKFLDDKNLNYFPLSGLSNQKTIHCNENGYYSIYQSDRHGFNNPDEEWDKDEIELFLIGDSYAHGACVNEPDTISGNLRKLDNSENGILNLGQGGSGPLIQYAILREYLPVKNVKRVLWLYYEGNDLRNLNRELNSQILVNYLKDENFTQNLILMKQEAEKLLLKKLEKARFNQEAFIRFTWFVKLYSIRQMIFPAPDPVPTPISITTKVFENILKLSNKLTRENNSKLYFIYLPAYDRYTLDNNHHNYKNYKKVIEIVESLNIPVIDINKELFEKHNDLLSLFPFRVWGHYNEKGYKLVAKTILNKIKELEK